MAKREGYCGRHDVDYYGTIGCPTCIITMRRRYRKARQALRLIEKAASLKHGVLMKPGILKVVREGLKG